MRNITLAIDDAVLEQARSYAAKRGTTVNALVREHLEQVAGNAERLAQAMRELREMSERTSVDLGPGYRFNREEIYEERMFPRHERPDLRGGGKE